jgi:hypothetical protein
MVNWTTEGGTALELTEAKDWISLVKSGVAGLWAAMADGSAKVEKVQQEVAGLKVQFSGCCSRPKKNMANMEQEFWELKEEKREL